MKRPEIPHKPDLLDVLLEKPDRTGLITHKRRSASASAIIGYIPASAQKCETTP